MIPVRLALLLSILALTLNSGDVLPRNEAPDLETQLKRFVDVLNVVREQSSDRPDIDQMMFGGAIPSMLQRLDPHSQFFNPTQFDQLRQMQSAEQKGFGSIVSVLPGRVIFLQTLPGTPSAKAGIQPGDELLAIGSVVIANLEPNAIIDLLSQARQQKISILVRRSESARPLTFTLEPALVDAPSVDRQFQLGAGVAYIRIASWDEQTAKLLRSTVQKAGGAHLSGLVLDLRNNPGGVVGGAIDSAALFLLPGQPILSTRGRAVPAQTATVPPDSKPFSFRLAIVINEKTASASEIFTGALQDHQRATVVGTRSYGKGLVQSVMPLSQGTGIALTTAFYYTPEGRSIQRPLRDSALSRTFDEATAHGGIVPDQTVQPPRYTRFEEVLLGSGAATAYATDYVAKHHDVSPDFKPRASILDDFKVFLAARRIQPDAAEWSVELPWIRDRLAEEIVTQALGVDKGDEIAARTDPQTQAALEAIRPRR